VAFALALIAVAWLAVRATDDATSGAVDVEFAEPVNTDAAMQVAQDNYRLAHFSMRAADAREARALDRKLDRSDAKLNAALGTALSANGIEGRQLRVVDEIRAAFPAYLTVRERIVSAGGGPLAVDTEANRNRLRVAFDRLQAAQEAFGAEHFAAAGATSSCSGPAPAGGPER